MGKIAALVLAALATPALAEPTVIVFPMSHADIVAKCGPQDDAGCADISPGHCNIFLNEEVAEYDALRQHAIESCHAAQERAQAAKTPPAQ